MRSAAFCGTACSSRFCLRITYHQQGAMAAAMDTPAAKSGLKFLKDVKEVRERYVYDQAQLFMI